MLHSFTRNFKDESVESGFAFTFYCDKCKDGFKSSFIESDIFKRNRGIRNLGQGAAIIGSFTGNNRLARTGNMARFGNNMNRNAKRSPEWEKERQNAFVKAQNEAQQHFNRCPNCNKYVCGHCLNEDAGLCTGCAPRQEVYVARAHANAMKRDIDAAGKTTSAWQGSIESKTTICGSCGKPAGIGKFCNNCGASMELRTCPKCSAKNAQTVRFCNSCGENLYAAPPAPAASGKCSGCGKVNLPGAKFCNDCGNKLG